MLGAAFSRRLISINNWNASAWTTNEKTKHRNRKSIAGTFIFYALPVSSCMFVTTTKMNDLRENSTKKKNKERNSRVGK